MPVPEIDLQAAWQLLADDPSATLLDVRTQAEWAFVGVANLQSLGKEAVLIEWTQFPSGTPNPTFAEQASKQLDPNAETLVICRSGARSQSAAEALTQLGFTSARNVIAGFEGHHDAEGHRTGGWKSSGLPWFQQ